MSAWHWIVALVAGFAALVSISNPAWKHDHKIDKEELNQANGFWIADQHASGRTAHRTNTNLVGIRLVLNRIKTGIWLIVALLVIIAGIEAGKLI